MNQKTKNALKELGRSVLACVISFITAILAGGN